ncbi:hypothetical protein [Candidatus Tisiphia endosymbiont of Nemotelus uliginosus]|uniref:hypothetical protein n=1 Tax=Candidatus Tisiphia endosymbiont of Nemotelus uliginosus TaxID=3077926 RepID=UPI0035C90032
MVKKDFRFNTGLIGPYGGILCERYITNIENIDYQSRLPTSHSHILTQRQSCDLELLLNGGFSPLTGFMNSLITKQQSLRCA